MAAMTEMLTGGDLDVLTGDYLAELTMLILARDRVKDPTRGYASTFLRQLETNLGTALDKGVPIVANAGGLNTVALAEAIRALAARLGLEVRVGYVTGDDVLHALHRDTSGALAANAYLGAFGIAHCLLGGADVVVTGRVTDASLTVGPAIAHFGWTPHDLGPLAGAVVAGHIIECGPQATGGNFSFFTELADLERPFGFPIAELAADGSSVITKHPGTGGGVTVETVTAQLLYEIGGPRYLGPDVTARLDTVRLRQLAPDRVEVTGVMGEPPPATYKVGLASLGGFSNEVEFLLTGLDIEAKASLVRAQLVIPDGAAATWTLARTDHDDADTEEAATARLRCTVRAADPDTVGRAFSAAAVELALAGYPGLALSAPPAAARPVGVFTADAVPVADVSHRAVAPDAAPVTIEPSPLAGLLPTAAEDVDVTTPPPRTSGSLAAIPLGRLFGARSGDKGGDANLGVWARDARHFPLLLHALTVDRLRELLPEAAALPITRHTLPNLHAVNFVIQGLLGRGVADNVRFDPQAKGLGEWLRSRVIEVDESLLP